MQRLEGVDVDETRNKIENGSSAAETVRKAATSSTILGEKEKDASSILNNVVVRGPDGTPAARSASPENAGAFREHQKRMGETAARGEAKEVRFCINMWPFHCWVVLIRVYTYYWAIVCTSMNERRIGN